MDNTLLAVYIALQTAPFIAIFLITPYTIAKYLQTKSIPVSRCAYAYVFVLYALCAYFMTMMPFPSRAEVAATPLLPDYIRLIPFKGIENWFQNIQLDVFLLVLFNVFLLMPLGFFLRFLWNLSCKTVVIIGFGVSLLFEITQITGLFFIYAHPYRIFDVNDLITNTLGAFLGFFLVPFIGWLFPKAEQKEDKYLSLGSEVPFIQRSFSAVIDFLLAFGITVCIIRRIPSLHLLFQSIDFRLKFPVFSLFMAVILILYTGCIMWLCDGRTIGYAITGLKLHCVGKKKLSLGQCVCRTIFMYLCTLSLPFWLAYFLYIARQYVGLISILWVFLGAVCMFFIARFVLELLFNAITHGSSLFYDRLCSTYLAFTQSRQSELFGIHVIDMKTLNPEHVDILSEQICKMLEKEQYETAAITRIRLMAEGVMLDWIDRGLYDMRCELRLDSRYKKKFLIVSIAGPNVTLDNEQDTYVHMLNGLHLSLVTYYAGEKNICRIEIPNKN